MTEYYENGPEGMPRVERMTRNTIMAVLSQKNVPTIYVSREEDYNSLCKFAHAVAEETLARVPAWPAECATQPAQDQVAAVRAVPEVALQDFKNGIHRLVMRHIDRMNDVSDNDCAEQIIASFVQGFDGLYEAYMPLRVAEIEAQRAATPS